MVVLQRKLGHRRRVVEDDPTVIWEHHPVPGGSQVRDPPFAAGPDAYQNAIDGRTDGRSGSVDVFGGALVALTVLEVDLAHLHEMQTFAVPSWAWLEVTDNKTFTGGSPATLNADDLAHQFQAPGFIGTRDNRANPFVSAAGSA